MKHSNFKTKATTVWKNENKDELGLIFTPCDKDGLPLKGSDEQVKLFKSKHARNAQFDAYKKFAEDVRDAFQVYKDSYTNRRKGSRMIQKAHKNKKPWVRSGLYDAWKTLTKTCPEIKLLKKPTNN